MTEWRTDRGQLGPTFKVGGFKNIKIHYLLSYCWNWLHLGKFLKILYWHVSNRSRVANIVKSCLGQRASMSQLKKAFYSISHYSFSYTFSSSYHEIELHAISLYCNEMQEYINTWYCLCNANQNSQIYLTCSLTFFPSTVIVLF